MTKGLLMWIALYLAAPSFAAERDYPNHRPVTPELVESLGKFAVVIEKSPGIEKGWVRGYKSASERGLPDSGLVPLAINAAFNDVESTPPRLRALRAAKQAFRIVTPTALANSLSTHLRSQSFGSERPSRVTSFADVTPMWELPAQPIDGALVISTSYKLSENADSLRVAAWVTLHRKDLEYKTPYKFTKSPPKAERRGPVYRNLFVYFSDRFPVPENSFETRKELNQLVEKEYYALADSNAREDKKAHIFLEKELRSARDELLTAEETSVIMMKNYWLAEDGALLMREIKQAHAFIAKYLLIDLNTPAVPDFEGADEFLEQHGDGRSVYRVGQGYDAGAYFSRPESDPSLASFGNDTAIATDVLATPRTWARNRR